MIKVFPRRTKWTPNDELAFVGDPPLFRPDDWKMPVRVSVTFTWDIPEALRLAKAWNQYYSDVLIGGPACGDPGDEFEPSRFVKEGITITSRGCPRNCPWCFVPQREGKVRELLIKPGWNVADNNLLACSRDHIETVFEMLRYQHHEIHFSGGLDARLFRQWHVDLLKSIRLRFAFFACDYPGAEKHLEKVADLMSDFSNQKKRCYVMIGYNNESLKEAEARLKNIYRMGFDPFAMLYRNEKKQVWPMEWNRLQRKWCRPAAYREKREG